jgi:hypothetical protein
MMAKEAMRMIHIARRLSTCERQATNIIIQYAA